MYNYDYKKTNNLWLKDINLLTNNIMKRNIFQNEYNQVINSKYFYKYNVHSVHINRRLNNIMLCNADFIDKIRILEYADFLILYIQKKKEMYDINIINKLIYLLKSIKDVNLLEHKKDTRNSYRFCKKKNLCDEFRKKKCRYDHLPYNKVIQDLFNMKKNINNPKENKVYINTIQFVINEIYNNEFISTLTR